MTETFKPVPGFEGRYEVSDEGRVRSLRFRSNGAPRILKSTMNWNGYHVLTLGAERRQVRLHCLVLEAFVGPRPSPEHDGCHGDNNKDNNHLSNLRWDTKEGNIADRRSYAGDDNPNAKLTKTQREEIKRRRLAGERPKDLAAEYGVTPPRICQICRSR